MDPIGLLAIFALLGIFAVIGFGIAEYKRTTCWMGLATSIATMVMAYLLFQSPELRQMVVSYGRVFQPEAARTVVGTMYLLLWFGGLVGFIASFGGLLVLSIISRHPKKPARTSKDPDERAYRSSRFNKYDV